MTKSPNLVSLQRELQQLSDDKDAQFLQRFFKTGPGEYAEGDRFRGIRVPALRKLASRYTDLPFEATLELLHSPFHEDRMLSLLIWMLIAKRDTKYRTHIFHTYIQNAAYINNWDLVDVSAPHLAGPFLESERAIFEQFVLSPVLWERRIAVIASFYAIRNNHFEPTLTFAGQLRTDPHDLMHKAVGWMLREIGKRNVQVLEGFLLSHYREMPRTMLRYAIERFPERRRQDYLQGRV